MIFPKFFNRKFSKSYIEALKVSKAVESTKKSPKQLRKGEFVIITLADSDKTGQVINVKLGKSLDSVFLKTSDGVEEVKVGSADSIHVVEKGPALKDHTSYERDLHDVKNEKVLEKTPNKFHKFPPTTKIDKKVDTDKTSELPASKKLSLRKHFSLRKESYLGLSPQPLFRSGDFVYTASGIPAQIIEILPGDKDQAAQAIMRSSTGNRTFVEYLTDLTPIESALGKSLKTRLSLRDPKAARNKIAHEKYNKPFDSLSDLEKSDINDQLSL